ncbi:DUF2235 domain-containing protein [Pseudomonas putida]|uniref:T6SS phospholipase effector Tle1-like catalytic domain-containing protein n=1 Tax=Pseudomonas putida TaxID=303 RepID=UPI002363C56B|nr:DUF2235 domain-containing protein [Pseudomonas putida]MDD1965953.1 DUF2235 domain-containing protein [Pseudomonas putida]
MQLEKVGIDPFALTLDEQCLCLADKFNAMGTSCTTEFHLGFFFDGTNNNRERDIPKQAHSNVARLYDTYEEAKEQARIYVPGVGTPFEKETSDTGRGYHARAGLGAGWGGEARINWALLQITNYFYRRLKASTVSYKMRTNDLDLVKRMSTDINLSEQILKATGADEIEELSNATTLGTLGYILDTASVEPRHKVRRQVLKERRDFVSRELKDELAKRKPKLLKMRISVFGFSRGAAEARVFCNWLKDALDDDMTLAGVPVSVDFLGIFDTVASVGLAQSAMFFKGHGGWGQEQFLRIPDYVKQTLHLVSAHEVRGSFPLDTVGERRNCTELVYPGVHSDVGGGYPPGEQGRGCDEAGNHDDSSKLSQIPLAKMYRSAVAAGVPLNMEGPHIIPEIKNALKISPTLRTAFNDYVDLVNELTPAGASTTEAARTQYALYLRWRRLRVSTDDNALEQQPFFSRAETFNPQDGEDLRRANDELREEMRDLLTRENEFAYSDGWMKRTLLAAMPLRAAYSAFEQAIWGEKVRQWREVKPHWQQPAILDPRAIKMFDDHVHDSRAWFKPFGATSEDVWKSNQRGRMRELESRQQRWESLMNEVKKDPQGAFRAYQPMADGRTTKYAPLPLSDSDREAILRYRKDGSLPLESTGRESSSIWGYLRWRTHYAPEPTLSEQAETAWNQVKVYSDEYFRSIMTGVDNGQQGLLDAAAELLQDPEQSLEKSVADELKRWLSHGLPRL